MPKILNRNQPKRSEGYMRRVTRRVAALQDPLRERQDERRCAATVLPKGAASSSSSSCTPPIFRIAMARLTFSRPCRGVFPAAPCFRRCGYAGDKLRDALAGSERWTIEIIKRSDKAKGFQILPRPWVVERTFAWLGRCRRLAKDWETTIASSAAWATIASIRMLTRGTARYSLQRLPPRSGRGDQSAIRQIGLYLKYERKSASVEPPLTWKRQEWRRFQNLRCWELWRMMIAMPSNAFSIQSMAGRGVVAVKARSGKTFARHTHEDYGIGILLAGAQRSWSGRGTVEAGVGDLITVNPGEVHDGAPIGGSRTWQCYISRLRK
jgi:hypothetical protein